ncbi:MAG TPA: tail fiber protein [Saprospiraceae bacterium]|nr:tail fiber protein [Saprospiraceae bacterium]HMQ85310.1 tail fiber protein [Saprospiraceae bacterium]
MDPIIGQIQPFGFNFPPKGWALCDGQILPISTNTALFSLLGVTYGGNGQTTFALPDLRGRAMMHQGNGLGIDPVVIGQKGGNNSTTLSSANLPSHTHAIQLPVNNGTGGTDEPAGAYLAASPAGDAFAGTPGANQFYGSGINSSAVGNNQSFSNMQPYLTISICIALQGIYPARN